MLRILSTKPKLPWCCFGNFNEVLEVHDKGEGLLVLTIWCRIFMMLWIVMGLLT